MMGSTGPVLLAGSIEAQTAARYGGNVTFASRYEWRGVTRRNAAVVHPELFLSYGRDSWIAVGAWTNLELRGDASSPGYLGSGRRWFGELNVWSEGSVLAGPIRVAVGGARYWLRPGPDSSAVYTLANFNELYGRVTGWGFGRLVPEVAVYRDFGDSEGTYGEASLTWRIPFWIGVLAPLHSILFTGRIGASLTEPPDPSRWYFEEKGVTHADFSLGTALGDLGPIGPFTFFLHPELHYQIGYDPATESSSLGVVNNRRWWMRLGIGLTGPTCRPDRQICP